MVAFEMVCPTRLDLLHIHYRRLCHTLVDVDEWGQVNMLNLLLRYVRTMLAKPSESGSSIDPDIQLLLTSAEPLFMSRNPAVSAAMFLFYFNTCRFNELNLIHRSFLAWLASSTT
jgi:AP-3 complex subunit beta